MRTDASDNLRRRGAYELAPAVGGPARAALFATGTEVAVALAARAALQAKGVPTRVVSCPCFELFAEQDDAYQEAVIGPIDELRIGIEAAISQGWWETFEIDAFVGMEGFGASAPAKDLYAQFGITADAVTDAVLDLLGVD